MHSENKLSNHGKQVTSGAQSQLPNVNQAQQQGPAGNQGSKGSGSGSHGVKSSQISPGNPGLKSLNQSGGGIGGMMKTKAKRERSVSMDTGEQRESLTPVLEPDAKGRRNETLIQMSTSRPQAVEQNGMRFIKTSDPIGLALLYVISVRFLSHLRNI
ncbi:hypothetical protein R3I94_007981 [Phoxinus phoxinus]